MMAELLTVGRDTYCLDTYEAGRTARGVRLVAQRCYHRLITPLGDLLGGDDEKNFGLDLSGFIGANDAREVDAMLPVKVRNELLKDPTVEAVTVTAERTENVGRITWTLTIKVVSGEGPFDLIVGVSDVTVELLGVR
jgi:hypothetical protein